MSATEAKPIVEFRTKPEHYHADACVVWCFDDRFYKLLKKFGKKRKFGNIDLVKVAGGAKALAEESPERDFLIGQIKTSVKLHAPKHAILMVHRDCGGYGGSKNFADADAERAHLTAQLQAAKAFARRELPGIFIETYFADFDGLYPVE